MRLLLQQGSAEEQQVEAGQQVAQPEDADARGPCDEHHHQHQPEEVAEDSDFQHVEVGPAGGVSLWAAPPSPHSLGPEEPQEAPLLQGPCLPARLSSGPRHHRQHLPQAPS